MLRNRTLWLVVALAAFDFAVLSINGSSRVSNAHHGVWNIIGEITWLAFLAGCLALIGTLITWAVRTRRHAATTR